jgi:hypothetical protein
MVEIIYHNGGAQHGRDVFILHGRIIVNVREETWSLVCDLGEVGDEIMGIIVEIDVKKRTFKVQIDERDMSNGCQVNGWNSNKPIWHTRPTAGRESLGCLIGSTVLPIEGGMEEFSSGSLTFNGFVFDLMVWNGLGTLNSKMIYRLWKNRGKK